MPANILITGHRGYIGSALVNFLSGSNFINKIVGYDLVDGNDILDYPNLLQTFKNNEINIVVHLAAISSVSACNDNAKAAMKTNSTGTNNVLRAMKESGCKNIIYASTSSVYGNNPVTPYTEEMKPDPCSPYGITKLWGEFAIQNHFNMQKNRGNYFIFRMFNVVGTCGNYEIDMKSHPGYDRLFGALQSGYMTIYGNDYNTMDGTCERDYVSLKDVCAAYLSGIKVLVLTNRYREIINICTGVPVSVKTIIDKWNCISEYIACDRDNYKNCAQLNTVEYDYGSRRAGDPEKVYGANRKANMILDWKFQRKIEHIIREIAYDKNIK